MLKDSFSKSEVNNPSAAAVPLSLSQQVKESTPIDLMYSYYSHQLEAHACHEYYSGGNL
jgi:hypothetical protein